MTTAKIIDTSTIATARTSQEAGLAALKGSKTMTTTETVKLALAETIVSTIALAHYSASARINRRDGLIYVESEVFDLDEIEDVGEMGVAQEDGDAAMTRAMESAGFRFVESGALGDGGCWSSWVFVGCDAEVALSNDPERATLVADMTDEEVALCIRNAAALDADILEREDGAHDTDRAYVAAYAASHLARYGEVWTLP